MSTPSEIKSKFGSSTALTITLNSLANAQGRQSTIVDNSSVKALIIHIYYRIVTNAGSNPADQGPLTFYLIRSDGTIRTFGAGTTDADITIPAEAGLTKAQHVRTVTTALDTSYRGDFTIYEPGIEWGIAFVQATGQALGAANNTIRYVVETQEKQ